MDINRLRYFITVAETESIRKAAEMLSLSPAALSKSIKVLEEELGYSLLISAGRGISISEKGRRLARQAKPILESLLQLRSRLDAQESLPGKIKLGTFEVFSTYFFGKLIHAELDDFNFDLYEQGPGEIEKSLANHQTDVGITYIAIPHSDLDHLKVCTVEMGIFSRKNIWKGIPFDQIPFAIPVHPAAGVPNKMQGLDGWPDGKVKRLVKYRVGMMESAMELCRQGLAVAYLPKFVVRLHNSQMKDFHQLHEISLPKGMGESVYQSVYLVKRKSNEETQEIKKIARAIRLICGNLPS